ncbi:MAG: glycosyltransferase [Alteromonadaceae bacterium]|nr:glycosyltransferase [Alteromonadaceae bacterium]
MHALPLVTVWIPTFNRKQLLERALNSVLKQSYKNIEIYIVDNGSTDGTEKMIEEYLHQYSNIIYHRFDANLGACAARNYAIVNAKGEFVTGLDDDDEFLPQRIDQLVKAYDDQYTFVCTGFYWDYGVYRKAKLNSELVINLQSQFNFNQASNQVLVRKQRLIEVGLFDENMVSCQDWDIWTRLIIKFGPGLRISNPSYIVHTAHSKPRITGSIENRLTGLKQFYQKYHQLMSTQNIKCFTFLKLYNAERKLTFLQLIKLFSWPIKEQIIRYFFASHFPKLAEKRLARLRTK